MIHNRLLLLFPLLLSLAACDADVQTPAPEAVIESTDEFGSSFSVRNQEVRADIIAELITRDIAYRLNADGSIGYRKEDGEAIDAVYYWAVGLYAARN